MCRHVTKYPQVKYGILNLLYFSENFVISHQNKTEYLQCVLIAPMFLFVSKNNIYNLTHFPKLQIFSIPLQPKPNFNYILLNPEYIKSLLPLHHVQIIKVYQEEKKKHHSSAKDYWGEAFWEFWLRFDLNY